MKNKIVLLVVCVMYSMVTNSLDEFTSQLFMFTRPIFNTIGIHQSAWHDFGYTKQNYGSSLQVYGIYAPSFSRETTPEYFLFDHKRSLDIRGGSNPDSFSLTPQGYQANQQLQDNITTKSFKRDILGQWFNYNDINTTCFTVNPKQKQACLMFEYNQDVKKFIGLDMFELWYVAIRMPVTYVSNNLGLKTDSKGFEILTNNNYRYANFSCCDMDLTRLSNIHVMMGTKYLNDRDIQIISSLGVVAPLVEQNNNHYLFEPVNGFNSHFSINSQMLFQFPLLKKDDSSISRVCYFLDLENNFLARNSQYRTFDLKGKPYSRYLKLLDIEDNSLVPAMNVLTLDCRVEPFNLFNLATGFRFKYKDSTGEIGYEFWGHGSETVTVEPTSQWQDDRYGIAFINADGELAKIADNGMGTLTIQPITTSTEAGQTASESTINFIATPDGITECCPTPVFTQKNKYLTLNDLDNDSAASRSAMTHRLYASVTLGERGRTRDFFANLGLFIEATENNAALSVWGGWAKFGLVF